LGDKSVTNNISIFAQHRSVGGLAFDRASSFCTRIWRTTRKSTDFKRFFREIRVLKKQSL